MYFLTIRNTFKNTSLRYVFIGQHFPRTHLFALAGIASANGTTVRRLFKPSNLNFASVVSERDAAGAEAQYIKV